MKRRVMAMLLALCMGVTPVMSAMAEEMELFISTGELVLDKSNQTDEESALDSVNKENASILEELGKKDWTSLAASVSKKGDWREDIVAVAQTQVGYTEEADGMTIYTKWAEYETAQEWTALFVNWVTAQAGLEEDDFPRLDTYNAFTERMNKLHALKNVSRSSYPMSGDLALIEKDKQQLIGIVVYVSNGVASVIIGDDNGAVATDTYYVGQSEFDQYIDLDVLMERAGIEVGKGGEVPVIPEGGVAAWTNTNAVYMRSEPTTASKRVTTVKKTGTALLVVSAELEADGYIWYGVEYGKYEGYIRGDLLDLDRAAIPTATPVPTATPAPTATPVPTEVPGCVSCAKEAEGVALPVECCYEHLASMGAEESYRFMSSLLENDYLTFMLYVNCHNAHVDAGEAAVICRDCEQSIYAPVAPGSEHSAGCGWYNGSAAENVPAEEPTAAPESEPTAAPEIPGDANPDLELQERVVNIEVKKALVGEAITISFDIYGATAYQWHEVTTNEDLSTTDAEIPGAVDAELTVYAKPGAAISYYCVATLPVQGHEIELTSKLTTIAVDDTPIVAEAILGEEVNFTYEYVGAAGYSWYKLDAAATMAVSVQSEDLLNVDSSKFTTYATVENAGAYYFCEALDENGYVVSTSSYFMYTIKSEINEGDLCKYVNELVNMTRSERYDLMMGTWMADVTLDGETIKLADAVMAHWKNHEYNDYSSLLCTCSEGMKKPFGVTHDKKCGWYIESTETVEKQIYYITATYGANYPHQCEIKLADSYELYYEGILVQSSTNGVLYFTADDEERVYECVVTQNGKETTLTYVVSAHKLEADRVQYGTDVVLDAYLAVISNDYAEKDSVGNPTGVYERKPIYELMAYSWNKEVMDYAINQNVNLAQTLLSYWNNMTHFPGEDTMFCTCCINNGVVSDKIMLHPDALHKTGCPWYEEPKSAGAANGVVVSGALPAGVTLSAAEQVPDYDLLALMQGANDPNARVSLKAYDITPKNADGTAWQPAKDVTVKVTIPNVYIPGNDVVVNVYHLLVSENEIVAGYGYEKLSSEHFNGVILNDDGSITFETDGFSTFYVEVSTATDPCIICDDWSCAYSVIISATDAQDRWNKLYEQNGSLASFLNNYYNHVESGAFDLLCSSISRGITKEQLASFKPGDGTHASKCPDENYPWHQRITYHTGVGILIGSKVTLNGGSDSSVWYRDDVEYAAGATIEVEATAERVVYTCKNGDTIVSTHVVVAQTSVLYYYVTQIANDCYNYNTGAWNKDAIYELMTGKWNVMANSNQKMAPVNLAQSILAYWDQTTRESMDAGMFCSCCFTHDGNGNYTFDGIMRRPNDLHEETCDWWQKPVEGLTPLLRADGTIEGYVLAMTDAKGNVKVVATTDMLDGVYHYFKDVESGLYVAVLDIDATGNAWIIPLKTERESAEETPAN